MVWNNNVTIADRELYQVDPNPIEKGNNIGAWHPEKVNALENQLLNYLKSVNAETVKAKKPKKV